MTYNEKEIIQSLNVIKSVCIDYKICSQCPLRTEEGHCALVMKDVENWKIINSKNPPRRLIE